MSSPAESWPSREVFIALFETLNWLDALTLRPEATALIEPDLVAALRFVRGRVHHRWAEAMEFRRDVSVPIPVTQELGPRPAVVVAHWCWRDTEQIPGGKRHGDARGEPEYRELLARHPVRGALDQVALVAGGSLYGSATS